jgi:PAS domain S-box-containing protein
MRQGDGETIWFSMNAQVIVDADEYGARGGPVPKAAVCSFTDVTERRRYESNLRALIEGAPDAVIVHREGRVVYVNPKTVSLLGYESPDEMIGIPVTDFIHPDFHDAVRERVRGNIDRGVMSPAVEQVLIRRDGTEVHVEINGLAVEFDGKKSVLAHARDITERRRLERQLVMAERLASIGRLAAAVGHEINNPLAYVMGNLEVALRTLRGSTEEMARMLEAPIREAMDGAERVRHIVRDLKVFSRHEPETRAEVDVRQVLESCLRMAENELRHRARVVRKLQPVPMVMGNEARLGQVFLNLLVNAAQSIPEGASDKHEVTIETGTSPDGRALVIVRDTGTGIAPEHLARIFEPFFTTKHSTGPLGGRGTGLGLSICHSLVTAYGGEIDVNSKVGQGTEVRVILPAAHRAQTQTLLTKSPVAMTRKRILIVDDEPLVARTLERSLPDHDVTVVGNGREAIDRLANSPPFDLVLCDLMMPGFSGMDLYEHVKKTMPGVDSRFVFMTGGAFTPRAEEFLAAVKQPYLEKPFQLDELLATVRKMFDGG